MPVLIVRRLSQPPPTSGRQWKRANRHRWDKHDSATCVLWLAAEHFYKRDAVKPRGGSGSFFCSTHSKSNNVTSRANVCLSTCHQEKIWRHTHTPSPFLHQLSNRKAYYLPFSICYFFFWVQWDADIISLHVWRLNVTNKRVLESDGAQQCDITTEA